MLESLELLTSLFGPQELRSATPRLRLSLGQNVALPTPLVAYDLPWYKLDPPKRRQLADGLDAIGITIGGLQSEFRGSDQEQEGAQQDAPLRLPLCPYRPERFGLQLEDLQQAKIIDLRLHPNRDEEGLPFYASSLLRNWDLRASQIADDAEAMYGGMQSIPWPPDVRDVPHLKSKINQLRRLNPKASICISLDAIEAIPRLDSLVTAGPDMIGLDASRWPSTQAETLATLVADTADFLQTQSPRKPFLLLVPPPQIDVRDGLKLLALGADLIAIDGWCADYFGAYQEPVPSSPAWASNALGLGMAGIRLATGRPDINLQPVAERVEAFRMVCQGMGVSDTSQIDRRFLFSYSAKIPGVASAGERPKGCGERPKGWPERRKPVD